MIDPVNRLMAAAATVTVVVPPRPNVGVLDVTESEKSGALPTATVTLAVRVPTFGLFPEKVTV
jgi:hypothetical protein